MSKFIKAVTESNDSKISMLVNELREAIIKVDDSLDIEDLATAIAIILKEDYGSHNFSKFTAKLSSKLTSKKVSEAILNLKSLSEQNLFAINSFKSLNINNLESLIHEFVSNKDNHGKDGKFISAKLNNDATEVIKETKLILVTAEYFVKTEYLVIEFMLGSNNPKYTVSSPVFKTTLKYNSFKKSFELQENTSLASGENVLSLIKDTEAKFNAKRYNIVLKKDQIASLFK